MRRVAARWATEAVILLLSASPAITHEDEHPELSFSETVQLVVRASREGFRPLKTFRIEMHPSRDYWYNVTNALPGASTCRIFEHPRLIYKCEWTRRTRPAEGDLFSTLGSHIESALGDQWTKASAPRVLRLLPRNPRRQGVVEIIDRSTAKRQTVDVVFYVPEREW